MTTIAALERYPSPGPLLSRAHDAAENTGEEAA